MRLTIYRSKLIFSTILVLFLGATSATYGQEKTVVVGKVYDANTKQPLPFVGVTFKGTYVGVSTDLDGQYKINTKNPSDTLMATFVGYKTVFKVITKEERQRIDFYLEEEGVVGDEITIVGKKQRYRKKNNPAVELINKVIANKDKNKLESQAYYNFDKHEKIELDLNNITDEFRDRKHSRILIFYGAT